MYRSIVRVGGSTPKYNSSVPNDWSPPHESLLANIYYRYMELKDAYSFNQGLLLRFLPVLRVV